MPTSAIRTLSVASLERRVMSSQSLEIGLRRLDAEVLSEDEVVDALLVEDERHPVDVGHVERRYDGLHRQAREQRDLAADVVAELRLRAAR